MNKTARRCATYVRISVAQEASVSIDRQVEAAEQYAGTYANTLAAIWTASGNTCNFTGSGHACPYNKAQLQFYGRARLAEVLALHVIGTGLQRCGRQPPERRQPRPLGLDRTGARVRHERRLPGAHGAARFRPAMPTGY